MASSKEDGIDTNLHVLLSVLQLVFKSSTFLGSCTLSRLHALYIALQGLADIAETVQPALVLHNIYVFE